MIFYKLIQSTIRSTILLALGLTLIACATSSNPGDEVDRPLDTGSDSISDIQVPTTPTSMPEISLPDLGPAPDFTNEVWLNSDRPLNLADLQGQVVLVEFWTFG